jgi:hypothetical protein
LISAINADPDVSLAVHLGDIKNGSTLCTDTYFTQIRTWFDTFVDPLVYTPGDNEWTDCHRVNNGGFVPTERLDRIRQQFFPIAGLTIGGPRTVVTQASDPAFALYKEDVRWEDSGIVFATIDVPGSNNDQVPWFTGVGQTRPTSGPGSVADQTAEYTGRTSAVLAWIDAAFDRAVAINAPGVFIGMQADMWDSTQGVSGLNGFDTIIQKLADRASAFAKPVLLFEGDSHIFLTDNPLSAGAPQRSLHPAIDPPAAPNLTRVVVQGQTTAEWLKVAADPNSPAVFSFARQNVGPPPVVPEGPLAPGLGVTTMVGLGVLHIRRRRAALCLVPAGRARF